MFYIEEINGIKILKNSVLNSFGIEHFFTTKESVIFSQEFELQDKVLKNKQIICEYLGIKQENLIRPTQTHGSNIEIAQIGQSEYPNTDAMILTNNTQAVFLNFADCTPIILYDKKQNIAGIVHAGWKGTVAKIAPKTINKMIENLNSHPKNIIAIIGPTISKCCFEIVNDVYNKLKSTINETQNSVCFELKNDKIFADLKNINKYQILSTGVENIDICSYCTSCDNKMFFSYRKENGTTSRHSAIIKLK